MQKMKTICLLLLYCLKASHWSSVIGQWRSQLNQTLSTTVILLSSNVNSKQCRKLKTIIPFFILALIVPGFLHAQQTITGTILNNTGAPVVNAGVTARHSQTNAVTNANGVFSIIIKTFPDTLLIAHVSYGVAQYAINNKPTGGIVITLNEATNQLDETVVIAYGKTTRRLNTGNVSKLDAKAIGTQPVNDPLLAVSGRIAGVTITQGSGNTGATTQVQIRGRSSIAQGSTPLFIIDGVPFAPGNENVNQVTSMLNGGNSEGLSAFFNINPGDIESIEVLKDADATAIYGSRGANGVILITTKKGKTGATIISANISRQWSYVPGKVAMLQTQPYMALRREAFANDGVTPTLINAPDLLLFDSTRYTDYGQYFFGGTAAITDVQLAASGGSGNTNFRVSGHYRNEGTVYPGSMRNQRMGADAVVEHRNASNRFGINAGVSYSYTHNDITGGSPGNFLKLAPHFPAFFDSVGSLNWQYKGYSFTNPMAYTLTKYSARNHNLNGRAMMRWRPVTALQLSLSAGYNHFSTGENSIIPIAAQNPANSAMGTLQLAQGSYSGWIAEPQAEYSKRVGGGRFTLLVGAPLQRNTNEGMHIQGTSYASDDLLKSIAAAPTISFRRNTLTEYRYQAVFARVNYNYRDRYIVNASGRRDGSSRFGPGYRFSNFGAVGAAWIFSSEGFVKRALPMLSYGKLRGSYGTTGNDQIGDYNYLDNWNSSNPYNGSAALYPTNLYNPAYRWELNKKLEAALELGFMQDRLLLSVAWYRNRSGNQLVAYRLPVQAGFGSILRNLPAVVENTGTEVELTTRNIQRRYWHWTTSLNITFPQNRLLSFPGLATSSYANSYVEGQPLNVIYRLQSLGVDPATGVFMFEDVNKNGAIALGSDYVVAGHTDPVWFGGLQNDVRYRNFSLSVFFDFRKQTGRNAYASMYQSNGLPGSMNNMPVMIEDRWRKPGDITTLQKVSAVTTSAASRAAANFLMSDGIYSDASYLRLKNIGLSYRLPPKLTGKAGIETASIYLNCQNLFTITNYLGLHPETQELYELPPMRTVAFGISLTL